MITISFYNNKGGVAKTTSVITTAFCLARKGQKVLVVDMDPQGNCSDALGVYDGEENARTVYTLLTLSPSQYIEEDFKDRVKQVVRRSEVFGCDVLPSNIMLDGFQDQVAHAINREYRLKRILHGLSEEYDVCLIDCPPSLSLLSVNALTASNFILIPCDSSKYALTGMGNLVRKYHEIKEGCNPQLSIIGILNTKVDGRYTTAKTSREKLHEYFGELLFESYIPQNASVEKSQYESKPLFFYDRTSPAFRAYESFVEELISRVQVQHSK